MSNDVSTQPTWWGSFNLDTGVCKKWRIGPLTLIVRCLNNEWQVAHQRQDTFDDNDALWQISDTDQLPERLGNLSRYIFRATSGLLSITPMLADRHVISRPHIPFNLTAGEETTLYVSSPLWLALAAGSAQNKMEEIAIQRPSDTWFGPSTREGELCYASTTHGRLHLEELPHRPHRAITPVTIINQADTTLSVERLNVPAPRLSLYTCSRGQLWTPTITLVREKDGDFASLKIDDKPPSEADQATQLSKPRNTIDSSALIRAFSAVFS